MGGMTQRRRYNCCPIWRGDDLNVALLVPVSCRTSRTGQVDVLSAHYGSPGRLTDYRRHFEKTTRSEGEDPSISAIALETLAVKAFGDMGQTARLRLMRDRFIAGHSSCELRRYLESVPPDSYPRCCGPMPSMVMLTQRLKGSISQVRNRFMWPAWLATWTR